MQVTYISHGLNETGGYRHEKALTEAISEEINNCSICYKEIRFKKNYRGFLAWILLFLKAFANAKGDLIVTVSRLAWPVYLRNIFNKNKIVLVLHNFDKSDGKPGLYFKLLEWFFEKAIKHPQRLLVVTVANYWKLKLLNEYSVSSLVFPNFFENSYYFFYRDIVQKNNKLIHFGQWSEKMDKKKYHLLWYELKSRGYQCYFSSPIDHITADFPVEFFEKREAYLKKMALARCTIILNSVSEGWNRVAHESLLLGTQVITNDHSGPSELMELANGYVSTEVEEIVKIIESENLKSINFDALHSLDEMNKNRFLTPVIAWIKQ